MVVIIGYTIDNLRDNLHLCSSSYVQVLILKGQYRIMSNYLEFIVAANTIGQ
jgi:hypothetical protein